MVTAYHHLETLRKEKISRKAGETVERGPRRLLEGYYLAEDSERQADVKYSSPTSTSIFIWVM